MARNGQKCRGTKYAQQLNARRRRNAREIKKNGQAQKAKGSSQGTSGSLATLATLDSSLVFVKWHMHSWSKGLPACVYACVLMPAISNGIELWVSNLKLWKSFTKHAKTIFTLKQNTKQARALIKLINCQQNDTSQWALATELIRRNQSGFSVID